MKGLSNKDEEFSLAVIKASCSWWIFIYNIFIVSSPPKIRKGFLFLKFGQREGSRKNCSEIGVSWKGDSLRKGGSKLLYHFSFRKVLITIGILFLSGKYPGFV